MKAYNKIWGMELPVKEYIPDEKLIVFNDVVGEMEGKKFAYTVEEDWSDYLIEGEIIIKN